jgi:hypothetical protein
VSTFTGDAGDPSTPAINLGYQLLDGTTGKAAGIYSPINLISSLAFENVIVCAPELVCRGGRHGEQDLRLDNRAVLSRSSEDALAFGTPIHPAADQQLREQPNYSASGLSPKGLNGTVP